MTEKYKKCLGQQLSKYAQNSPVLCHGMISKMPKSHRSAGHKKTAKSHRSAITEKCQKVAHPRSRKNAQKSQLVPLVSMAGIYNIVETEKSEREVVSSLTVIETDPFDSATYQCNASNVVNEILVTAVLTVYGMPFNTYVHPAKDGS